MAKVTLKAFSSFKAARTALSDKLYSKEANAKGVRISFSNMTIVYPNDDIEYYKAFEYPDDADRIKGLKFTDYELKGEIPNRCLETILASIR